MNTRSSTGMLAMVLMLVVSSGCDRRRTTEHHPFSWQLQPAAAAVTRIVVLPIDRAGVSGRSAQGVDAAIAAALRDLSRHVVIEAGPDTLPNGMLGAVEADRVSVQDLLTLRDRYHADAVLIGRLHQFQGYDPVAVGLTMHLVSCHDGSALWSATGHFDGARTSVQDDVQAWYRRRMADRGNTVQTWRTVLHTPSLYSRYVADRMLGSLIEPKS